MKLKISLVVLSFLLLSFDQDKRPNVLIIGDSISLGYTPFVAVALKNKANVIHNKGNAQHTGTGLERIDDWLGDTVWDVIHFNWGLWDLCYRHPDSKVQGKRDKVNGTVTYTPEQYRANLEALVVRLEKTGAKLIFAETSYVPEGEAGRFLKSDRLYNKVALSVMKEHGVEVNRLNHISKKIHKKHAAGPGNVHYTKVGYELLSQPVAKAIEKSLDLN